MLQGNLDRVTRDGWVSGWCWYPDTPDEPVDLVILVDDEPVGGTRAAEFRADLREAGIGEGNHGFSFALPWSSLAEKGVLRVTVRERGTASVLGDPILIRAGRLAVVEERIQDLELQIRLLRGQIEELGRRQQASGQDRAARELFVTVAAFFQALGQGKAPDDGLKAAVDGLAARLAPLVLAVPEAPLATLCIDAGASAETIHGCLAALHEAAADARADIVLLDDGALGGEAALLPALVRNLQYRRVAAADGRMAARNAVAASARGAVVAYLAPQIRVAPGWLDEIIATFDDVPEAAVVGAKIVRDDGRLHHAGIVFGADGSLRDPGRLAAADDCEHDFLRPVHGFGDVAVALRRDMMLQAGGFAPGFADATHATMDLCLRLQGRGRQVLYQPLAVAAWAPDEAAPEPAPVPDIGLQDEDARRLRQRCLLSAPPQSEPAGHALVIDSALPRPDDATLAQMLALRQLGYRVSFAATGEAKDSELLRRRGIEVVRPPRYASLEQYLAACGGDLDLVQICPGADVAPLADRVAELAPQAKRVLHA